MGKADDGREKEVGFPTVGCVKSTFQMVSVKVAISVFRVEVVGKNEPAEIDFLLGKLQIGPYS